MQNKSLLLKNKSLNFSAYNNNSFVFRPNYRKIDHIIMINFLFYFYDETSFINILLRL